ncbi:MAG: phosphate ABC transporter substrate-binding protein PstS [Actinobacteria bacterium]|nr:phosphate ABC transporter substrate-binding protein PstS [Actinomycetota bacterium]MBI3688852.1 phosphate ABC transporter substrate-binding protein PstS [Actinomycetota bacterium]
MRLHRQARLASVVTVGALALAACGSDNVTPPSATGGTGTTGANAANCASGSFTAAGSSAQKPAFNAWIQGYQGNCANASVNYDGQGSGNGRTQFIQKQVPLAGSDSYLPDTQTAQADARCTGGKAVNIPMVLTPVAMIYNLKGVTSLTLTPSTIAKIFSGKITSWNDPAIAAANKGVPLPATTVTPVHRATDSGTTDNFTKFLAAQAPTDWTFGSGQAWKAPGGVGGKDSAAVVQNVKGTDGAIGYVDGPDARKNNLTPAALDTGSGPVEISADSVGKAVEAATTTTNGQDISVKINYGLKAAGTYPAILATYEITCTAGLPSDQAAFVRTFLTYTSSSAGQGLLANLGHLPLPASLLTKVQVAVAALPAS